MNLVYSERSSGAEDAIKSFTMLQKQIQEGSFSLSFVRYDTRNNCGILNYACNENCCSINMYVISFTFFLPQTRREAAPNTIW